EFRVRGIRMRHGRDTPGQRIDHHPVTRRGPLEARDKLEWELRQWKLRVDIEAVREGRRRRPFTQYVDVKAFAFFPDQRVGHVDSKSEDSSLCHVGASCSYRLALRMSWAFL